MVCHTSLYNEKQNFQSPTQLSTSSVTWWAGCMKQTLFTGVCKPTPSQAKQLPAGQSHVRVQGHPRCQQTLPKHLPITCKGVMRAAVVIVLIFLFCITAGNSVLLVFKIICLESRRGRSRSRSRGSYSGRSSRGGGTSDAVYVLFMALDCALKK